MINKLPGAFWFRPVADSLYLEVARAVVATVMLFVLMAMLRVLFERIRQPSGKTNFRPAFWMFLQILGPLALTIFATGQVLFDSRGFELNRVFLDLGLIATGFAMLYQINKITHLLETLTGLQDEMVELVADRTGGQDEHS